MISSPPHAPKNRTKPSADLCRIPVLSCHHSSCIPAAIWHKTTVNVAQLYALYAHTLEHSYTQKHFSFTHSADMHTLPEHSFAPTAKIQVTPDHFTMFFLLPSACPLPFSSFLTGYLYSISLSLPPHLSVVFSLLLPLSLLHFSLLFLLSVVSRTNKGVWNVSVLTCTVSFGSGIFMQNSSSIYCRACSHTAQAYAIPNSAYIIG